MTEFADQYPYGMPYLKIEGPFRRDPITNKLTDVWRNETVHALRGIDWVFTEKVDGTNVRINWDGYKITFNGRTDKAQLPGPLNEYLTTYAAKSEVLFEQAFGEKAATIYGEGFGPGIQKGGGNYGPEQVFAAFDIHTGGRWLSRPELETTAPQLNLQVVPVLDIGPLERGFNLVESGLSSLYAHGVGGQFEAEGVVAVPEIGGYDRYGKRIIVKIKAEDFR